MRPQPEARTRHQPDTSLVEPRGARRSDFAGVQAERFQVKPQVSVMTRLQLEMSVASAYQGEQLICHQTHAFMVNGDRPFNLAISLPRLSLRWLSLAGP
jgi:hypothetical protein